MVCAVHMDLQPPLQQRQMPQLATPDAREVRLRVRQQLVDVGADRVRAGCTRVRLQDAAHQFEERATHVLGERASGSSPSAGRSPHRGSRCARSLSGYSAAFLSFNSGGIRRRARPVRDREPGTRTSKAPGHRHVVHPLDRIMDDQVVVASKRQTSSRRCRPAGLASSRATSR